MIVLNREKEEVEYNTRIETVKNKMGIRESVCVLAPNFGSSLSLRASSYFFYLFTQTKMGFHITLYVPGVFLRLKKDLRDSCRNACCIFTFCMKWTAWRNME